MENHSLAEKVGLVLLAVCLGVVAGYVDMTDHDVQLPALILLGSAFLLGSLSPRLAWLWSVLIGLSILTAQGLGYLFAMQPPYPTQWLPLIILPLAFALAGAVAGVLMRWLLNPTIRPHPRQGE